MIENGLVFISDFWNRVRINLKLILELTIMAKTRKWLYSGHKLKILYVYWKQIKNQWQ